MCFRMFPGFAARLLLCEYVRETGPQGVLICVLTSPWECSCASCFLHACCGVLRDYVSVALVHAWAFAWV